MEWPAGLPLVRGGGVSDYLVLDRYDTSFTAWYHGVGMRLPRTGWAWD